MLKPLSNHAQRESLNLGHGFSAVSAIAEHAGQSRHLGEPAAITVAFKLNVEGHKITLHPGGLPLDWCHGVGLGRRRGRLLDVPDSRELMTSVAAEILAAAARREVVLDWQESSASPGHG